MKVHFTDNYLLNPGHRITVNLIGLGGTGSQMLGLLARLNEALISFDHPGIHVICWDGDIVTEANVGRQLFSRSDLGHNKATVLATRLNRFFGLSWEANPCHWDEMTSANITITCVDSAATRVAINKVLKGENRSGGEQLRVPKYWLDLGNSRFTGQAVLGTVVGVKIKQPKSEHTTKPTLKTVIDLFPALKSMKEADEGPSCSLAEAINKQDLYINSALAQFGANMLWKLFRAGMISVQGCYINLETLCVNPIKI